MRRSDADKKFPPGREWLRNRSSNTCRAKPGPAEISTSSGPVKIRRKLSKPECRVLLSGSSRLRVDALSHPLVVKQTHLQMITAPFDKLWLCDAPDTSWTPLNPWWGCGSLLSRRLRQRGVALRAKMAKAITPTTLGPQDALDTLMASLL